MPELLRSLPLGTIGKEVPRRDWSLPIQSSTIEAMALVHDLEIGDVVELTEAVDAAPVGARGGVVDLLDSGHVMVEVMTLPLEPILDRIVIVPPGTLHVIKRAHTKPEARELN
jgi:hypothetical protein